MITLVRVWRRGKFGIHYTLSDGTESGFKCSEEMSKFIIEAWCKKHEFQDASNETIIVNKPCTFYDPITVLSEIVDLFEMSPLLGRCKNCGSDEGQHRVKELKEI
jgi:hypothetical protein